MIKKIIFLFFFTLNLLSASNKGIDKKILDNKQTLKTTKKKQTKTHLQMKILAKQISKQNRELDVLQKDITKVNSDIKEHQTQLEKAKNLLSKLQKNSSSLIKEKKQSEEQIVKVIIDDFVSSIALKLAKENNLQELIDSQIYTILSQNAKDEILKINNNYALLTQNKKENKKKIEEIYSYIQKRKKKKTQLSILKKLYSKSLLSLEEKHKQYQGELEKSIEKQESLKQLLAKLNILKKEELEKQKQENLKKAKKLATLKRKKIKKANNKYKIKDKRNNRYAKNIDLKVRILGSSTSGIKISRYRGKKTIAPLDSCEVLKKFGKYFDPVYRIELFNESVVLKTTKPQAKVKSIFNGKIVYAKKDAGMLENVVIIQHQNGLHTIYSHLDKISPSLKVGRWVKRGYVVGRINNTLTFEAIKNSAHIDPKDLFKI